MHLPTLPAASQRECKPGRGQGETILVMEDDEDLRGLVGKMLVHSGYTALVAGELDEAMALARNAGPRDLLWADVIMPNLNGRQVFDQMNAAYPGLKVLFMSGYTDDIISGHGILESGIHLISKPFTESALNAKIQEVLASAAECDRST